MTVEQAAKIAEQPVGVLDEDVVAASKAARKHLNLASRRKNPAAMTFYGRVVSKLAAELELRVMPAA